MTRPTAKLGKHRNDARGSGISQAKDEITWANLSWLVALKHEEVGE